MLCSMGSTYKPFSLSENQVDTGPSWFNLKYLPFWSRKTYVTKIQPFQVIPFRLVWLGLISWQSTQHHWNTLWILWPNKNITATIWTCPDPGWQNMFMKKESSWCWLVPNFQLPEFHGKQKTQPAKTETSRFGGFLLHWKNSKKDMLSGIQYARLFLQKKLDCSLQYYYTVCWTKNNWIQTKIQTSFQQRCVSRCHGVVVVVWW